MTSISFGIRQLLRRKDFEGLGDHERGLERNRRALITGSFATLARIVQVGSSLITVPLTLKYLGNERFGLWMTISSVLAMASFADFGVGNGVLNTVAKAFGKDDMVGIRKAISSGFAILGCIAVFLIVGFFSLYRFIHWGAFFRVTTPLAKSEAGPALAVFATCFAMNISMDVVQRVQLGLQQGYRYSLWQLCGSTMGFIGVLFSIWLHASLPVLIAAVAGAPVLATSLNAIHFFGIVKPELRPSIHFISGSTIAQIGRLGLLFFVLQSVCAISFSADNFIIARNLGAVNVPEYSIPQRMFAVVTMISAMLVAPLWPAYGEAISRGHFDWVRKTLRKSLLLVFGATSTASLLLLILAPTLLHWWVGSRIHPSFVLLAGLAVWTVIGCCGDALAMFMNGAEIIRFQMVVASIFGIACLAVKVLFVRHFGITGVPWATIVTYLSLNVLPCAVYIPLFVHRFGSHSLPEANTNREVGI
jgi:O-antigen/teichoic acid export membrane protein